MAEIAQGSTNAGEASPAMESDFSPRKLKIALGILIGQTFATSILPFMAMGFAQIPMRQEFGWTSTEYSFAGSMLFWFGALSLWPIGRMADRWGVRPVLLLGTIIVGLITIALSFQTNSLVMFYLVYALLGVFGSTGVTYMKVIATLFTQNRGKAMAILGAEATIVGAGIPFAVTWLLTNYGWRNLYLVFGIVILAVVPLLFFTIEEPGRRGIDFQLCRNREEAPPPKQPVFAGLTLVEAMQTPAFWIITLAILSGMFMLTGMGPHMVPAILAKGFTLEQAAWVTSLTLFAGFAGTLVGGIVDHVPSAKVASPFSFLGAVGAVLLLLVTASWGGMPMLIASVALGGFSFFAFRPIGSYIQTRFFGLRSFTEIMGVQFMIVNLISGFAPTLVGYIFDTTHSYEIPFYMMIGSGLLGTVCWLMLPKYRYDKNIGQMPAPGSGMPATASAMAQAEGSKA